MAVDVVLVVVVVVDVSVMDVAFVINASVVVGGDGALVVPPPELGTSVIFKLLNLLGFI